MKIRRWRKDNRKDSENMTKGRASANADLVHDGLALKTSAWGIGTANLMQYGNGDTLSSLAARHALPTGKRGYAEGCIRGCTSSWTCAIGKKSAQSSKIVTKCCWICEKLQTFADIENDGKIENNGKLRIYSM